jgi:HD-GYP domain-containing protein (c-di-GMP phosphodiesterase class II)
MQDLCRALSIGSAKRYRVTYPVPSSHLPLKALNDQNDVDSITKEALDAINAANVIMTDTDAMTSNSPLTKNIVTPPRPPQQQQQQQQQQSRGLSSEGQNQLIAATFSGTVLGAIVSVLVRAQLDDSVGIDPIAVTGILSVALGAATYVVAKNPDDTNLISKSVRFFLGQPILNLGMEIQRQVTSSIEQTTKEIQSIPNKIQQSVEQTVDDTVTSIQNIPTNLQRSIEQQIQETQNAATQKVQDTVSSIQQIPNQVKDAALEYADEIVTEIKATPNRMKDAALDIADDIVTEIKATPDKVQKSATAFVQETIDDISSIPSKIVASVETTVSSGGSGNTLPQPPKLPPPLPKSTKDVRAIPSFIVPELPKIELPKIDISKVELPSIPKVDIPIKRAEQATVTKKSTADASVAAALLAKRKAQEQEAVQRQKQKEQEQMLQQKMKIQQEQEAAQRQKQREQEQLAQQKKKLQLAKLAAQQKEQQLLAEDEANEERRRIAAERERQREQDILRKAQEALQRSREAEDKRKVQEIERKKQQDEALKKRQQQIAEQQATVQIQKQPRTPSGSSGSVRITTPQSRAPRGIPTIISWKQRKDGGISGRIYGSTNFNDGERVETSVIVTGTVDNGYIVKTDSGSRYFLSTEKPITNSPTSDSSGPLQALLSALPGATISLTKSAQENASARKDAIARKKADDVMKPRPTFSLFGSQVPSSTSLPSTVVTKASIKAAPRGVPTIQRWRKNRDGSVTGSIYGSSNFSDGEQVTTSPIAMGTLAAGELVRTGSGSKYFLG